MNKWVKYFLIGSVIFVICIIIGLSLWESISTFLGIGVVSAATKKGLEMRKEKNKKLKKEIAEDEGKTEEEKKKLGETKGEDRINAVNDMDD